VKNHILIFIRVLNMNDNIYQILEVSNFASLDDIKLKYKQLIKQNHPDKGGESDSFNKIKNAYEFLKQNKDEYDRKLKCILILL
jgi:DnaJ-class molecular chaperone